MKKLTLLLVLSASLGMKAQDSISSPRLGITSGISTLAVGMSSPALHAGLSFSSGKHEVYITSFFVSSLYDMKGTFPGFGAGYQFYPNGIHNRFDLLFAYDFIYFSARPEYIYPSNGPAWAPVAMGRSLKEIENYLGFGFRAKIISHLFFSASVGIGAGKSQEEIYWRYADGTKQYSDNGYNEAFALHGKIRITYHFLELKKKKKDVK